MVNKKKEKMFSKTKQQQQQKWIKKIQVKSNIKKNKKLMKRIYEIREYIEQNLLCSV